MSNLYFYAGADDQRALIEYVFGATDCRVYEAYSNYDAELREFRSLADIESIFALGDDPGATSAAVLLSLWSPRTRGRIDVERIALKVPGHKYRYSIGGWGMLQLQLGGVHGRELTKSRFCHNTEVRARAWESNYASRLGQVAAWDWGEVTRLSRAVQYHIRSRLSSDRFNKRPVLRAAAAARVAGVELRFP
jgi:hypothetical protein